LTGLDEVNNEQKPDGSQQLIGTLLACGIAVGPVFYFVVLIQMLTRAGFDLRRQPISLLSLGDAGWIQVANFIVVGLLAIACAIGMRRFLHHDCGGTWGPFLIGAYGLGMIMGGIFRPDPALGFPPGTPMGMPSTASGHAHLHGIGFLLAFVSLVTACFVFARRFFLRGHPGWAYYSTTSGIVSLLLIFLGMFVKNTASILFATAGIVAFGWVSAIAARLRGELEGL
jgi:hypothetical protein